MALYEYECPKCGTIEIEHKMRETVTKCPECEKKGIVSEIKRLISLSSFALKGKGWYKDGYSKS